MILCPFAIWRPGPPWKQGYFSYPSPQNKEGFVPHSMVGNLAAALSRLDGPDTASWHFSVAQNGNIYQHYSIDAVCWHCGVVGDDDLLSAAIGNVALVGIEHEGGAIGNLSEPLTQAQLASTIRLQRWAYTVIPTLKFPALWSSYFEHRWLSATACPSGRIPHDVILETLIGKGDINMPLFVQTDEGGIYRVENGVWSTLSNAEAQVWQLHPDFGRNLVKPGNAKIAAALVAVNSLALQSEISTLRAVVADEVKKAQSHSGAHSH